MHPWARSQWEPQNAMSSWQDSHVPLSSHSSPTSLCLEVCRANLVIPLIPSLLVTTKDPGFQVILTHPLPQSSGYYCCCWAHTPPFPISWNSLSVFLEIHGQLLIKSSKISVSSRNLSFTFLLWAHILTFSISWNLSLVPLKFMVNYQQILCNFNFFE